MPTNIQLQKDGFLVGPGGTDNKLDGVISFSGMATPSAASTGYLKLYSKTDNKFYKINSSGTESEVGASGFSGFSGTGGGSSGFSGFSGFVISDVGSTSSINVPYLANDPLRKASSPNAFDEYFESNISNFSVLNNATIAWDNGTLTVTAAGTGGSNVRAAYKAVPAGSWTITSLVHHASLNQADFYQTGVLLGGAFTPDGKFYTVGLQDTGQAAYLKRYPGVTSNQDSLITLTTNRYQRYAYYRIQYVSGSSLTFSFSWDGVAFFPIVTEAWNAYLTSGPVNFGILQNTVAAVSSGTLYAVCKYIKLTSP